MIVHAEVGNPVETLGYAAGYHREVGSLRTYLRQIRRACSWGTFRGECHCGQSCENLCYRREGLVHSWELALHRIGDRYI